MCHYTTSTVCVSVPYVLCLLWNQDLLRARLPTAFPSPKTAWHSADPKIGDGHGGLGSKEVWVAWRGGWHGGVNMEGWAWRGRWHRGLGGVESWVGGRAVLSVGESFGTDVTS